MRYLVGYGPEQRGVDAIELAATMARSSEAEIDLVVVLPDDSPTFHMYSPDRAYNAEMRKQGGEWLAEGLVHVPQGVTARGHLRPAGSVAEGLMAQAEEAVADSSDAAMIVVGASQHMRLGSVADALLHSAAVPVALTPVEYAASEAITGITCAAGLQDGDDDLLDFAIEMAAHWQVPLRLLSLVAVGEDGSQERRKEWVELARLHLTSIAQRAAAALPATCPVSTEVGHGSTMVEALADLQTSAGEIVVVGSSRLAQSKRLFLGQTARKIMRELPVPVVVVPREYEAQAAR